MDCYLTQPPPVTHCADPAFSRQRSRRVGRMILALALLAGLYAASPAGASEAAFHLASVAEVTGSGVFLSQIVTSNLKLPDLRLCDAPAVGATIQLSRAKVDDLLSAAAPALATTNWTGADSIRILRRSRTLNEAAALALLTASLQQNYVKDEGKLQLSFTEPWEAPVVPDEPLTVKFLELPSAGVAPYFIARFQLCTATETVGAWQVSLQAHVWRDVWVAHSDLPSGELLADADVERDTRDVLSVHEPLAEFEPDDSSLELAEPVYANNILLAREIRPRSVIHRGQLADAVLQDGALSIMLKVVALQDGAPGQIIRARNPVSQRDLTGKVVDDHTIEISL